VRIGAANHDSRLELSIAHDGVGGADPQTGSGLMGLIDRVDALGGRIVVINPSGKGMRIRVESPIEVTSPSLIQRVGSPESSRYSRSPHTQVVSPVAERDDVSDGHVLERRPGPSTRSVSAGEIADRHVAPIGHPRHAQVSARLTSRPSAGVSARIR
jgi:hypothetical protein